MFVRRVLLPLHERLLNRTTFQILRQIGRPPAQRDREEACRRLLVHARTEIPFWRERLRSVPLNDLETSPFRLLQDIPVLTRTEIMAHRDSMVWRRTRSKIIENQSSGTTDDNLVFYSDRLRQSWDSAMRIRALSRLGADPGDRVLHIWPIEGTASAYESTKRLLRNIRDWATNDIIVDPRPFKTKDLERIMARCRRYRPKLIISYPSWLFRLASYVRQTKSHDAFGKLECLFVCGEVLFDFQRRFLETTFRVPVRQEYGSQDSGPLAQEDQRGDLRFNAEHMHVEFLRKGKPVAPGELGEVIVTHFYTQTMPFVRYATGDVVRCPADNSPDQMLQAFPLPEGRTSDVLVSEETGLVPQREIVEELIEQVGIWDFSLHQTALGSLTVYDAETLDDGRRLRALKVLERHLGRGMRVDWKCGSGFRQLRSGKKRYVCSLAGLHELSNDQESDISLARAWPQELIDG